MKIIEKTEREFKNLDAGDVFMHDGDLYMKIVTISCHGNKLNAIDLNTTKTLYFVEDVPVIKIYAELIIL